MILLTELSFALFSFLPTRMSTGSVQERYKNKYNGTASVGSLNLLEKKLPILNWIPIKEQKTIKPT